MQSELIKYYLKVAIPLIAIIIFEIYLFIKLKKTVNNERLDNINDLFFKFGLEALFLEFVALIIPIYVDGAFNKIGETGKVTGQIFIKFGLAGSWGIAILFIMFYLLFRLIISADDRSSINKKEKEDD